MSAKKRRAKTQPSPIAERRDPSRVPLGKQASVRGRIGSAALWLGVALGTFGVPSVFWFGLRNPFGPPKAFVLALAAASTLAGLALVPSALASAVRVVRRSSLAWALGALVALAALSTLTAIDVRQALLGGYPDYRGLLSVLAYAIVGVGAMALWERGDAVWIGRGATTCMLWVGVIGVVQRAEFFPTGARGDFGAAWRVSSSLGNSSNLGVFLVALLPLVVWVALKDPRREWRAAAWIASAVGALSLVWTLSRGAWLGAIVVGLVGTATYAWARRQAWRGGMAGRRRIVWVVGGVIVALAVAVAFTPTFAKRASKLFDSGSTTGAWRVSTWRSAVDMTLARPFLGFGPNQFRYAYPRFQAPGQIDGRTGYPVVESAHNLLADTSTSFGLLGLVALLVAGAISARVAYRSFADAADGDRPSEALAPSAEVPAFALGLGLLGGVVALQFHYVTMDTGPLLALALAGLAVRETQTAVRSADASATESVKAAEGAVGSYAASWAAAVVAALYVCAAVGVGGLLGADRALARADTMVRARVPWKATSAQLDRAEALAGWEAQIVRARGTLATVVVAKRFDSAAAVDGIRALDAASAMTPADAVLAAERGNLLLAAGVAAKDRALLDRSMAAFAEAEKMDPNTGIAMAGRASALLALHRFDESIALFQRALELSPRYSQGWRNLAIAYRNAGRERDAKNAEWRAKHWAK